MSFRISIPTTNAPLELNIELGTSTTFVGANGSGKSRLAVHLETVVQDRSHRISAHRALGLNPNVPKISEANAKRGLKFGRPDESSQFGHRRLNRWHQKEAVALLNDFDFLLQVLFAEQSRTALETHQKVRQGPLDSAAPTKFEKLQDIWHHLLPHRELIISGDDVRVRAPGTEVLYSASEMSDGERAIFYLTGQVLVAEQGALLVVDEPELHVHPSIMNKLWDQLENARPDCAFAFITHDLEFAAARVGQKFIIREYSAGPRWKLEAMPVDAGFPEEITTLLLGSRRPILFVEGDGGSLDQSVYRCVYPEWTVVPMGSCQDVIRAVATMRTNAAFTRLRCAGIVDADDYDVTEIERLTELGVSVLPVSELENVFLLPNISREIARAEHLDDTEIEARLGELRTELLTIAAQPESIDAVVRRHTVRRIDRLVKRIDVSRERSIDQIDSEFRAQAHALNIHGLAEDRRRGINAAIAAQDLPALLALLDNKGLIARAASRLRSTRLDSFESWLARILLNDRAPALVAALRAALPRLSSA